MSFLLVLAPAAVVATIAPTALAAPPTSNGSAEVSYTSSSETLQVIGSVNLAQAAATAGSPTTPTTGSSSHGKPRALPLGPPPNAGSTGKPVTRGSYSIEKGNVAGAIGFDGINGAAQATVNGGVNVGDLEPPDQGTCAGPDAGGNPITIEIINNAVSAYSTTGSQELGVTPNYALFDQPSTTFLSDPRCYYDASSGRWFFTEFVVGVPSTQFVAVSQTSDPLGNYTVFGIDTTDAGNSANDCPCYGDFDQLGADANGIYITTNEFNLTGSNYDGTVMYAVSKEGIEAAASGGPVPSVARYQISGDAFGTGNYNAPYHLSPSTTPPGGTYAPNTEYLVESNSNAPSDDRLIIYALTGTNVLATGGIPALGATLMGSEPYSFPPNASQAPGPIPLGNALGVTTVQPIATDFNAVQETTYTAGTLYAELSTAAGSVTAPNTAAAWFTIAPSVGPTGVSAQLVKQGYVASSQSFLYPDIVVDSSGNGYLVFSIAGAAQYPSPGYIAFHAHAGPTGPVHIAAAGTAPEDGFTCYLPEFFPGTPAAPCRWGDYSGGAVWAGRIYMMAEYIPAIPRDTFTNWGTYIWSAPLH
jgi:hypothetical protein